MTDLTPEQVGDGWIAHDLSRHPLWDGNACLMSDGTQAAPVGHQWAPFNPVYVIAYKPEQTND